MRQTGGFCPEWGVSGLGMLGFSINFYSKSCFSHQAVPPGKVKITSSGASDLKISHRLVHQLNRGERASDCVKIDSACVTAT